MKALLKTNLRRYFTHPLTLAALLCSFVYGLLKGAESAWIGRGIALHPDDFWFMLILFAQSAVLAVIVTSQHKDGIFRNKVIAGKSKGRILLAEMLAALFVSAALLLAFLLPFGLIVYKAVIALPVKNMLTALLSLLLIFFGCAALTVLLCSQMRGRILALMLSMGAVFGLYALNYFCDDALHTPEKYVTEVSLTAPEGESSYGFNSDGSFTIELPKDSGVHWNEQDILVGKDGKPVDYSGNPLPEYAEPVQKERPNPKYIGGPARIALSVVDALNPVRPLNAVISQFNYSDNPEAGEKEKQETEQYRALGFELLPQYLPWQLGVLAGLSLLGWLLFRRKELS